MNELESARVVRVGQYEVGRIIGTGGMSVVYEVIHQQLGRHFAMKMLNSQQARHPKAIARLKREAQLVARLRHPNVVVAIDYGVNDSQPYLVMELVEGETLAARLRRVGRFSLPEMASVFLPVCSAVATAHDLGIVHRDLKPSNIILESVPGGRFSPKVLDFGISRCDDDQEASLTGTGAVLGTVSYLSPEHVCGAREIDAQSDVFALAVMFFECVTGQLPFTGETSYDVMHAIATRKAPTPSTLAPELPPAFDSLIAHALERSRASRTESAIALGRELLGFADPATRAMWSSEFTVGARDAGSWVRTLTDERSNRAARLPLTTSRARRFSHIALWAISGGAIVLLGNAVLPVRSSHQSKPAVSVAIAPTVAAHAISVQPAQSSKVRELNPLATDSAESNVASSPSSTANPARRSPMKAPHRVRTGEHVQATPTFRLGTNGAPIVE